MANIYKGQDRNDLEYDPFQNVKANNFDSDPGHDRIGSSQKPSKSTHPFSRDFVDSMFTVINRDLLYCKLFYFFFFGAFGSLFPLMAIYFKQLGMNAKQAGLLIGFRPFIEFLSTPFWVGLADRWRRGKEMLLFSLLCWIVFTIAIAFVQPPAHKCITSNGTHHVLEVPLDRRRRGEIAQESTTFSHFHHEDIVAQVNQNELPFIQKQTKFWNKEYKTRNKHLSLNPVYREEKRHLNMQEFVKSTHTGASASGQVEDHSHTHNKSPGVKSKVPQMDMHILPLENRHRRAYNPIDTSKIVNYNGSEGKGLLFNQHSVVVYQEGEVSHVFFILLLLVIVGEFFSAPAITFADSVTLSFLGDDVQNYGRQRMFGSVGWGLAMFFVGMALDHSTTFPDHPCGKAHVREKNYTVCFAVFSVLMCCAFLAALQLSEEHLSSTNIFQAALFCVTIYPCLLPGEFLRIVSYISETEKLLFILDGGVISFRFDHHSQDIKISEIPAKVKTKVKRIISGHRKIGKERLVEEYSDDEDFPPKKVDGYDGSDNVDDKRNDAQNLKINPGAGTDMVTDALKAPGAKAGRGFGAVTGAVPFGSAEASYSDQPFFGKWMSVMKLLATYQYMSVLFIAWFMGFGIGIIFTFLFWHLQDLDGSPTLFGVASVINHVSELMAYFTIGSFIGKYGLAGNIARFIYISLQWNPWWVLPFEFLQGLTHAAVWAASSAYITHAVPVELRSSAQSIIQGLHHGLGRGCGAVFGGLLVYRYGSVVTFRIYGVVCVFVLAGYLGINYFLQNKGKFSHGSSVPHEMFEDTAHLAPHGVPSGTARDLSSKRLADEPQQEYGTVLPRESASAFPGKGGTKGSQMYGSGRDDNPLHHGYEGERITSFESPQLPSYKYKKQYRSSSEEDYSP